ncbi:hypothetical protein [Tabrizicola sp.]|uniref:hypothetical protein n=1 Tax=Tabrizicola sp. TaxID=2005166 RepID=UPI0035B47833
MANRPALIKQADVTRLVKGVVAAGIPFGGLRWRPDGSLEIIAKGAEPTGFTGPDPDELLR